MSIRLLSYNIRHGGAGREKPLAAVINACEPDLVILQEASHTDVVERLAAACEMRRWGALRGHSLAFMTRRDVSHHAWHKIRFARRRYLEIALDSSSFRVFGVHLSAVHSNITEMRRLYELRSLLSGIAHHQHGFHVIVGDFNTLAPGEQLDIRRLPPRLRAIVWMTGRNIRWATVRLMLDRGYADAYRLVHQDAQGFTFPTWDPHVRLDYVFIPSISSRRLLRCEIVRNVPALDEASDHFPLLSEIAEE